jgi:hypothetical protein
MPNIFSYSFMILTRDVVYAQLTLKYLFKNIKRVVEQWSFVPLVVNELLKLDGRKKKKQLCLKTNPPLAINQLQEDLLG